jgi:DNA polymerase
VECKGLGCPLKQGGFEFHCEVEPLDANRLKTLKRLGVKYVTQASTASAPLVLETVPMASPVISEASPISTTPAPKSTVPGIQRSGPKADAMAALDRSICECQNCALGKTRIKFVFGSGDPSAEVLFVGESPGADEDEQGLPFVGRAGQLLTKIIESTKVWKREDVFICNVLKCRPPGNRTPQPDEVEACRSHLEAQIRILQPKLIMAMGSSAAQTLLKTKEAVGKLRGRWHDLNGIPLRVTYHPAALLRVEAYKRDVWEDMKTFTAKYQELKTL